jgi:hypothetical protein
MTGIRTSCGHDRDSQRHAGMTGIRNVMRA